jgi:hypothetical protein
MASTFSSIGRAKPRSELPVETSKPRCSNARFALRAKLLGKRYSPSSTNSAPATRNIIVIESRANRRYVGYKAFSAQAQTKARRRKGALPKCDPVLRA